MKCLVVLLAIFSCVLYTEAVCVLYDQEWECGKELGLSKDDVPTIYHKPNPLRARYTNCLWKKLAYLDENGDIDYNRIKSDAGALLTVVRICDDVPSSEDPGHFGKHLEASIESCKILLPSLDHSEETAERVRRCIQDYI